MPDHEAFGMGYAVDCDQIDGTRREAGRASLEGDLLEFRSAANVRIRVPLQKVDAVTTQAGILTVRYGRNALHLDLGERAERWAERIKHPPTRTDKLGLKTGDSIRLIGEFSEDFQQELHALKATVVETGGTWILLHASTRTSLNRLPPLGTARGLWIVYPRAEVSEQDVLHAGRSAGMTDVKVMRFSPTETALKFVARKKPAGKK